MKKSVAPHLAFGTRRRRLIFSIPDFMKLTDWHIKLHILGFSWSFRLKISAFLHYRVSFFLYLYTLGNSEADFSLLSVSVGDEFANIVSVSELCIGKWCVISNLNQIRRGL